MVKLAQLIPSGVKDLWSHNPVRVVIGQGVWVRRRLTKDENGNWKGCGRLERKHYKE